MIDLRYYRYYNKLDEYLHSLGLNKAGSQPRQARAGLYRCSDGAGQPVPS